ncbi:MAG: 50S ribosomal protein L1 [Planctomycetota bacterium]|jgi:large subunit ribosomal protein L1
MPKHGKRYRDARKSVDRTRRYELDEAVRLLKELETANFDETVEVAMKLGVDPRKGDQLVRGSVVLPHGTGRSVKVAVFAEGDPAEEANAAGADFVGGVDLVEKVQGGFTDFDVSIATPAMMRHVGKLGRILGPQGKMPSPKAGTVTDDVGRAVEEYRAGRVEYRVDDTANVHAPVGKKSFDVQKLVENVDALLESVKAAKPAAAKGSYIQKVSISTTMGPGVPLAAR